MMRILLAVNDSPAGLAAARTAITFAQEFGGQVLAVHVADQERPRADPGPDAQDGSLARERSADALLAYVTQLASQAQVPIEARRLAGRPAHVILEQAAGWHPTVIVLGRSGVRHVGQPFVGSQVLNVIEFADVPVLVVPAG